MDEYTGRIWPILLAIHFVLFAGAASAQNTSRIDRLKGGDIGLNLEWSGEGFSGPGARSEAFGGSLTSLIGDAQSISINPAGLGFVRGLSVALDWAPPLTVDAVAAGRTFGSFDIEQEYNQSLTDAAEQNSLTGTVAPGTITDGRLNSRLKMRGGLKGGALAYGTKLFTLAGSFHQPFRVESQLSVSGMEFRASALDGRNVETHRIFGTVNGNFNLSMAVQASTVAAGVRLRPNLAVGLAYDNMNAEMNFEGTFLPEGIIASAGGDTRAFNDPARVQYDSLFANIRGDWEGRARRFRGGLAFHPSDQFSLDAIFVTPFTLGLSGPFRMVHNNIRAFDLNAASDEEVFDVEKLVEDNLTRTEKKITDVQEFDLEMPGSLALGVSHIGSRLVASLVYTRYFDNLGYGFAYQQFDSLGVETKSGSVHQGVELKQAVRLGFGIRALVLGVGGVFGETFSETVQKADVTPDISERHSFVLPLVSVGGGFNLSSHLRIDYVVSVYNSSFLRFTTTYQL